ncbi:hypothetical protein EDB80DRAFT_863335 [Ilyonectria destructans]|nr:hypothetical protein EDB80DRAFT_863335 [Ilyonectria destructans]
MSSAVDEPPAVVGPLILTPNFYALSVLVTFISSCLSCRSKLHPGKLSANAPFHLAWNFPKCFRATAALSHAVAQRSDHRWGSPKPAASTGGAKRRDGSSGAVQGGAQVSSPVID